MKGFGTKFACNTMLLCITNVSVGVPAMRLPVQLEKIHPAAGLADIVKEFPTASNWLSKFGDTVPLPAGLTITDIELTTTYVTVTDAVWEALLLVSKACARMVFGPGIRPVTVADHLLVPSAIW